MALFMTFFILTTDKKFAEIERKKKFPKKFEIVIRINYFGSGSWNNKVFYPLSKLENFKLNVKYKNFV